MKKVSKYILTTLSLLLFVLSIYIVIFGTLARQNNQLLYLFNYSYANVPTASMEGDRDGRIDAGSFVFIHKKSFNDLVIDEDVVVFYDAVKVKFIVHRIIGEDERGFITKGDHPDSTVDTSRVTIDNYQGVVVSSFKILDFGENMTGIQIQVLGVLIVILFIFFVYQIIHFTKLIFNAKVIKEDEDRKNKLREEIKEQLKNELSEGDDYEK